MPWTTPTLEQVRQQNRDFVTAYLHATALVPNSVARVIADGNAGLAFLNLLYIDWLSKQFLPDTSETEWLDRHAAIWLAQPRKAATFATGTVTVTGISGTPLPAGAILVGGGGSYQTTQQVTVGPNPVPVSVRALQAGAAGNLGNGGTLAFDTAIPGVDGNALIVNISGGTDAESDDELRGRVLERIQQPPMGGDAEDYVAWAKEVPGVTRAWSYPQEMGIGTMTVRFMCDDLRADNDGFPLQQDVDAVTLHIDQKRPVTVKDFWVCAPIRQEIELTIKDLVTDNEATRANIEASVTATLTAQAIPGATIYRSWVDEAISRAVGEQRHTLIFNDTPALSAGHMAVLGSIIYA